MDHVAARKNPLTPQQVPCEGQRQGLLSSNTGRSTNPPHPCSLGPSSLRGPFVSGAASGAPTREHWRVHRSAGSQAASQRRGVLPTRAIGPNRDRRCISPTRSDRASTSLIEPTLNSTSVMVAAQPTAAWFALANSITPVCPCPPVFLGFALHGRRLGVLELEPVLWRAAHRHCHGDDGDWVFGVAPGAVSGGPSTARRVPSSFGFAFRRSREPSVKQCRRQKWFASPSSPPMPASASKSQVSGFLFFPQT